MKTKCYCVYCPKHPLYEERYEIVFPRGYEPGNLIWGEADESGREVDCLKPGSEAFFELDIEPEDYEYPITAYGDGCSITGFQGEGFTVYATCMNERYEDE